MDVVFPADQHRAALLEWVRDARLYDRPRQRVGRPTPLPRIRSGAHWRWPDSFASPCARRINVHYGDNFISLKDLIAVRLGRPRARLVVTVHHPTPWAGTSARKRWMTRFASWLADVTVAVSQATEAIVLETPVPRRKVRVIPNGIPLDGRDRNRTAARERWGLSAEDVAVVSICRLVEHKRVGDLIEAAARTDLPELKLMIAGEGPLRAELEELGKEMPAASATMLGFIDSVDDLLSAADVFALPSDLEGFGMVYVEAAAHGVPSIGCNTGGATEVIVDGQTGLLVHPRDVEGLSAALRHLVESKAVREEMGAEARRRAFELYDAQAMGQRYAEALGL